MLNHIYDDYLAMLAKAAEIFRNVATSRSEWIPCEPGCIECCVGLFEISMLDASVLSLAASHLPASVRESVCARARVQLESLHVADPRLPAGAWYAARERSAGQLAAELAQTADGIFEMTEKFSCSPRSLTKLIAQIGDVRCPLLDERDNCILYDFRPLVCRLQGLPRVSRPCRRMRELQKRKASSETGSADAPCEARSPGDSSAWTEELQEEFDALFDMEAILLERYAAQAGVADFQLAVCFVATALAF